MPVKSPVAYAQLLDRALAKPIPEWNDAIEASLQGVSEALINTGLEAMRQAYVAGLTDGFGQGVAAESESGGLDFARDALSRIDRYTGGDIHELIAIASEAIRALDDKAGLLGA